MKTNKKGLIITIVVLAVVALIGVFFLLNGNEKELTVYQLQQKMEIKILVGIQQVDGR